MEDAKAYSIKRDIVKHERSAVASKSFVKRVQLQSSAPLFSKQADLWLMRGENRRRSPFRSKTVETYVSQIEKHLKPLIGEIPVDAIGNTVLKDVAAALSEKKLSAATIELNLNIIKQIRASVLDYEGAQVYPYTWNSDFIDAPVLNKKDQKRPIANAQAVQAAISCGSPEQRALWAVLAGTGLRIAEALALAIGEPDDGVSTAWLPGQSKIIVRLQRRKKLFYSVKTEAGNREVDLPEVLNEYLKKIVERGPSIMFPYSENHYRKQLKKCGVVGGFHSLRRFRVTHLRMQGIPDALIHFWIGHEDSTVTGRYTEVGSEIQSRKDRANQAGLGFQLPEASNVTEG